MTNDFYAGFVAGSSLIIICFAIFQVGVNRGVQIAIRIIDEYPAAKNVLIHNQKQARILSLISEAK